jgi:hypothetical protein
VRSGGQREKEADRRVEAVQPGYCLIEKSHAAGPGAVRIVAEEVVVAGGRVVLGVLCREVVGLAVLMADDAVDQLADIPLRVNGDVSASETDVGPGRRLFIDDCRQRR